MSIRAQAKSVFCAPHEHTTWMKVNLDHEGTTGMDRKMNDPAQHAEEVKLAIAAIDRHMSALNRQDAAGLAASLHFPHFRLTAGHMKTWEHPDSYLSDFHARAGEGWHHSAWDFVTPVAAGPDKVHLDVQFTRYRADNSAMGIFRSLWVVTRINGVWATQLRSSYAA